MIGTGEGESPLAKPQNSAEKVDLRTLASDAASIEQSGGGVPVPYTPNIPPASGSKAAERKPDQVTPPGVAAGDIGFTPPVPPSTDGGGAPSAKGPDVPKKKGSKSPFVAILVFIVIAGLAAVGYFFVYPLFLNSSSSPDASSPNPESTAAAPAPASEEPQSAPVIPAATSGAATSAETQVSANEPTSASDSISTIEVHSSFFKTPADIVFDTKLSSFGVSDLLRPLSFNPTSVPLLREIVWKTEENKSIAFGQAAATLLPDFFSPSVTNSFQPDFTMFSYTNSSGTWLGFIAKLKDGIDQSPVQNAMSRLQHDPNLKNLFLEDPGTMGVWKDGKVLGRASSEVSFAKSGATISYTWFDRYLLVSTNLDAAKEAGTRLGY